MRWQKHLESARTPGDRRDLLELLHLLGPWISGISWISRISRISWISCISCISISYSFCEQTFRVKREPRAGQLFGSRFEFRMEAAPFFAGSLGEGEGSPLLDRLAHAFSTPTIGPRRSRGSAVTRRGGSAPVVDAALVPVPESDDERTTCA